MGMYDELTCEMPLPNNGQAIPFQTKDLDCDLSLYRITNNGRFMRVADPDEEVSYSGDICFYGSLYGRWQEYIASVENGQVTRIVVSAHHVIDGNLQKADSSRDETLIPIPRWALKLFLDKAEFGDTWPDEIEDAYASILRALNHRSES